MWWVLLLVLVSLIMLTVCGNALVCLAVATSPKLRCIANGFVVSLAATDLLLGLLVLPFSAALELHQDWPLGSALCNVYISLDVMLCTASILNLLAISMDRYLAITAPLKYHTRVTPARFAAALVLIWTVSLTVSFLPIHLGWNTLDFRIQNQNLDHAQVASEKMCRFEWNRSYVLLDSLATFYLPLLAMCLMYYRIFRIARAQARRVGVASALRDHKATVTLAAILGAFVFCWFPYFTFFLLMGLCEERKPPKEPYSIVLWLGYTNSALNPLLYATLNRDFRRAYGRLLHCPTVLKTPRVSSLISWQQRSLKETSGCSIPCDIVTTEEEQ
ncbi:histamine H2 receptor-like [Paramormyrops kingsleyae]|uniref:histamine H2 receptor-like n=1 Tax=Paramormyrops kingsleyae TaxID=1676925 RepID=UPI000CD5E88B|nr:histamine H2 receptor-like [Paramormyrops kingsleyae]